MKKESKKPTTKKSSKSTAVAPAEIPAGVRAFLKKEHLHLFKREDTGVVLPQGQPRSRPETDAKDEE